MLCPMNDIVIVGASVAGSAAAVQLARRGYRVELLERASFPRRKPCGEGLFSGGAHELKLLGVLDDVTAGSAPLSSMRFRLGDAVVEAPLPVTPEPHLGVRRDLLDQRLIAAAAEAGAKVSTGVQVRKLVRGEHRFAVETTAGVVEARELIAADGINSRLRHDAGLHRSGRPRRYGVSAHMRVASDLPRGVEVVFERGYELYLTPVAPGIMNVALLLGRAVAVEFKGDLQAHFLELLSRSGVEAELIDEPLMAGPFPAGATALSKGNLVLVGDAAGFFDPITGEGMSLALKSARLCAESVARYLEHGDATAFDDYTKQHRAIERNPVLLARLMLFLSSHRSLGRIAIKNLQRHPATLTKLIAINNGSAGLLDLRPRDLAALLLGR